MLFLSKGRVAKQAHVGIPAGLYEEEFGRAGFYGRHSHLYRRQPPVSWTRIEGPLRPRAFDFSQLPAGNDYLADRVTYLHNDDLRLDFGYLQKEMHYYFRNADGDELLFVHGGSGRFECDFGVLTYECGDYLVVPRGTVYRLLPDDPTQLLIIEAEGEFRQPERGILGSHALYDPVVIKVPELEEIPPMMVDGECELRIKRNGQLTHVYYPHGPLNVAGWRGDLTVWQLNVRDIRPISCERAHLPPSAHTTFVNDNFIVCSFLPRPLETGDPEAMKVPFYHANIDYDEVIFYHRGDFFSRAGIDVGMLTLHPSGIHHGPHPKAIEKSRDLTYTDEVAVMLDSKKPLQVSARAETIESKDYWQSWRS